MPAQLYAKPSFALLFMGAFVTVLVAQLRPNDIPASSSDAPIVAVNINEKTEPTITQTQNVTQDNSTFNFPDRINLDPTATKLNALLHDYFTTRFDEATQAKWQFELAAGTPFLSELGAYLKLDKIYEMELYTTQNQTLNQSFLSTLENNHSDNDNSNPQNLLSYLSLYSKDFWPMSIITEAKSSRYSTLLLLNNYDRDFLLKIERAELSTFVAPLAPGIERLLKYHLQDSVDNNTGLYQRQRSSNIDNAVRSFAPFSLDSNDFFVFYNLIIQHQWAEAATLLQSSDKLSGDEYLFLYDLLSVNQPDALLETVTLDQFHSRHEWWTQFLYFELCLKNNPIQLESLNRRLSLQFTCQTDNNIEVRPLVEISDTLLNEFWEVILSVSNLTTAQIEQFYFELTPRQQTDLEQINSHTILDFLARKARIKVMRNATFFQRMEFNFQAWQRFIGNFNGDSLYQFSPLYHWFSNKHISLKQSMNASWQNLLPQLSDNIQRAMASNIIEHLSSNTINKNNADEFNELFNHLSVENQYLLEQYAIRVDGFNFNAREDTSQLNRGTQKRLNEASYEILYSAQLYALTENSTDYDDFLRLAQQHMLDFMHLHAESLMAESISDGFMQDGQLSSFTIRQLERFWNSTTL